MNFIAADLKSPQEELVKTLTSIDELEDIHRYYERTFSLWLSLIAYHYG